MKTKLTILSLIIIVFLGFMACQKDKKRYHLGYFKTEEEAAKAYNEKAKELHQNFAILNIV